MMRQPLTILTFKEKVLDIQEQLGFAILGSAESRSSVYES